MTFDGTLDF